jgi:aminoglycoside phosphotransferase (APT) family kinase protein
MVGEPTPVLLDEVIADLQLTGIEVIALDGGITNHNFRVGDVVVRCPGENTSALGIDREAERAATERAAAAGVAPEVVAFRRGCLVTRFIEGEPLDVKAHIPELVEALRAVHGAPPIPSTFSPFRRVEAYARAASFTPPAFARELAARIEPLFDDPPVPCHNDLLPANLLWDGAQVRIVDWEYAGMGDRHFDLGNLSTNNDFSAAEEDALVRAYFGEPKERALARLRLMKLMSNYWEAMWGVLQAEVSALDFDFRTYADENFARLRATVDASPVDEWLRDAAG